MKTKDMILAAVLLALGTILHAITPPIYGVTPDMLLATMFLAIFIVKNFSSTVVISLVAGVLAMLTTKFPGGQIPSIIDKLVSGIVVYFIYKYIFKFNLNTIKSGIINFVGTFSSGLVFLTFAVFVFTPSMKDSFLVLVGTVVLPASIMNTVLGIILSKSLKLSKKLRKA
ncbi:tryptophan transporter [Miniphocaeibacter halophilus]|uniref:Tryptophan transporter n=1 Tax=Miniphocaeibacter halophilus TaxID=2931922 RepID=A0AC61MPB4_9FIRM|nr:tryptophan transporter [Miniphocaeibacter halophilus]QQK07375.1 tryptophan transporter [Miniphocaeibacter halophilus]